MTSLILVLTMRTASIVLYSIVLVSIYALYSDISIKSPLILDTEPSKVFKRSLIFTNIH